MIICKVLIYQAEIQYNCKILGGGDYVEPT